MPVKRYDGTNWVTVAGEGIQGPAGADGTAPLSTKGQLLTRNSSAVTALSVGTNNQVLTADSAEATGLKWTTPASGGMTLLSTTTLSGSTTTISSISQDYTNLIVTYHALTLSSSGADVTVRANASTNVANYNYFHSRSSTVFNTNSSTIGNNQAQWATDANNGHTLVIYDYSSSSIFFKSFHFSGIHNSSNTGSMTAVSGAGGFNYIDAITSIAFNVSSGTFTGGTVRIYGVK